MRSKHITILLIIAALLLAGCGQKEYVCPDGSIVSSPTQCVTTDPSEAATEPEPTPMPEPEVEPEPPLEMEPPEPETPPAETEPTEPVVKEGDEELFELLESGAAFTGGVSYTLYTPDEVQDGDRYHILNRKYKVELFEYITDGDKPMTVMYGALGNSLAAGFCEDIKKGICTSPNEKITIPTERFLKTSPMDWAGLVSYAKELGSETINNRNALIIDFKTPDGTNGKMWVEAYYGLPMKVEADSGTYEYRDMTFNKVEQTEMEHEEIEWIDTTDTVSG
ncbi:MAG: hypothetical protein ABIC95_00500 [archaeon]